VNHIGAGPPAPADPHVRPRRAGPEFVPCGDRVLARLSTVRLRLAALVLVAAIPLLMLSGTIAWQNYQLALDVSRQTVIRMRESAIARHAAAIDAAQQMMQSLAQSADLFSPATDSCRMGLKELIAVQAARYSNIAVYDRAGHWHCGAFQPPPGFDFAAAALKNQDLFRVARQTGAFALGPPRISKLIRGPIIPAAYPVIQAGQLQGYIIAGLRVDWFNGTENGVGPELAAVWIAGPTGEVTQLADSGAPDLPPPETLRELLQAPREDVIMAFSSGGAPFAYASAKVAGNFHLLVAYPATADQAEARVVLAKRAAQLAILLALGLAAVAVGTHRALVHPLGQLGRAVENWRAGGSFDPDALQTPPIEVRKLALSFAEATRSLAEQSEQLRAAIERQDLLIREIHHRVKNNLQIVASLLNLQASRIRQPEARAEFASARDRVRALATLHRHLYSEGELSSINMRPFLKELCGQLFDAMGERLGGRIGLTIEAAELELSSDQAVPLSLIVTEAVSNALKYAFPGGRSGHVAIFLSAAEGMATLVIQDDGVGIPAGRAETETGTRDGLGIQLIRGFARQLRATLDVHEGRGTTYRVNFPLAGTELELPEEPLATS
jgi:two-component sensor histidine kinase